MKKRLKFLDELTPKRMLTLAIIVVVVVVTVYVLWDKIVQSIRDARTQHTINKEVSQYGTGTLTSSQIQSLASQIYNAMRWPGTNETAVSNVLTQLGNNADYAALQAAYIGVNQSSRFPTLDSRIASEGTEGELRKWRSILQSKNITIYTF